ncbi:hypothetical protein PENTCL1PPCAC_12287, partial [Pristionchus entomophagus]
PSGTSAHLSDRISSPIDQTLYQSLPIDAASESTKQPSPPPPIVSIAPSTTALAEDDGVATVTETVIINNEQPSVEPINHDGADGADTSLGIANMTLGGAADAASSSVETDDACPDDQHVPCTSAKSLTSPPREPATSDGQASSSTPKPSPHTAPTPISKNQIRKIPHTMREVKQELSQSRSSWAPLKPHRIPPGIHPEAMSQKSSHAFFSHRCHPALNQMAFSHQSGSNHAPPPFPMPPMMPQQNCPSHVPPFPMPPMMHQQNGSNQVPPFPMLPMMSYPQQRFSGAFVPPMHGNQPPMQFPFQSGGNVCAFCYSPQHLSENCLQFSTIGDRAKRTEYLGLCSICLGQHPRNHCDLPEEMQWCHLCGKHRTHAAFCRSRERY